MNTPPWWVWLVPLGPAVLTLSFVVLAGIIQGFTTGKWPSLTEWCQAARLLGPFSEGRVYTSRRKQASPPIESPQDLGSS